MCFIKPSISFKAIVAKSEAVLHYEINLNQWSYINFLKNLIDAGNRSIS